MGAVSVSCICLFFAPRALVSRDRRWPTPSRRLSRKTPRTPATPRCSLRQTTHDPIFLTAKNARMAGPLRMAVSSEPFFSFRSLLLCRRKNLDAVFDFSWVTRKTCLSVDAKNETGKVLLSLKNKWLIRCPAGHHGQHLAGRTASLGSAMTVHYSSFIDQTE